MNEFTVRKQRIQQRIDNAKVTVHETWTAWQAALKELEEARAQMGRVLEEERRSRLTR